MNVMGVLSRFFGKEVEADMSKVVAKERLRLVLVHDRVDISESMMNNLRVDLIEVIGRYMEIDKDALEVTLSREEGGVALIANIPVVNVKRSPESLDPAPKPEKAAKTAVTNN